MIEGYVEAKDIFIVSYKKYLNKIMEQKIQELDLTKKYKGSVTGTSSFGIFVEWEEVYTGLIHRSEFDGDERIANIHTGDERIVTEEYHCAKRKIRILSERV